MECVSESERWTIDISGRVVLLRVDINQPIDRKTNTLKDTTRVRACVPTIRELSDKGAKLVLLAHQGSDMEYENFYTTKPHAGVLSELLGKEVKIHRRRLRSCGKASDSGSERRRDFTAR